MKIVILCGGSGTRLWPLSTDEKPKQFLKLTSDMHTLFQLTCLRANLLNPQELIIITNKKHCSIIKEQLFEISINNYIIIAEPFGKNTAAAIASASIISNENDDILVLSSDHVWDDNKFVEVIKNGLEYVNNHIIVFGIKPTYPETGYGYINFNNNDLIKFVEKPNIILAKEYLESGQYLWNSGIFLFKNSILIDEFKKNAFEIYNQTEITIKNSLNEDNIIYLNSDFFTKVKDDSIDYAILEKYNEGKVILYDGIWNDVGSYSSLWDIAEKDINNNVSNEKNILLETKNCLIKSKKLVATIGVENLIIIESDNGILVINKDKCQDIKKIVNILKK